MDSLHTVSTANMLPFRQRKIIFTNIKFCIKGNIFNFLCLKTDPVYSVPDCAQFSVYPTVYSVQCARLIQCSVYPTVHSVQCTRLYTVFSVQDCTLCIRLYTVYHTVLYTRLYTVCQTVHGVQDCTRCTRLYTVYQTVHGVSN